MLVQGKIPGENRPVQIRLESGRLAAMERNPSLFRKADFEGVEIFSPLFDPQVNGGGGISFSEPGEPKQYDVALENARHHGVCQMLATIITSDPENLRQTIQALVRWRKGNPLVAHAIPGLHLEGPGISPQDGFRGAHPLSAVRPWTKNEYLKAQELSGGLIKMVTLAPEIAGHFEVIEEMVREGVVVAMGHTNADAHVIARAIDSGVSLFTHWGNGLAKSMDRHANPLWPALSEDRLALSLISDGHHLPDEMIRVALKCKPPEQLVITADTGPLAGMASGVYDLWGSRVRVAPDGKLTVDGTAYLAGSGAWLDTCMVRSSRIAGRPLADIWAMGGDNIRKMLKLPVWEPVVGDFADMTLVQSGKILGSFLMGKWSPVSEAVAH